MFDEPHHDEGHEDAHSDQGEVEGRPYALAISPSAEGLASKLFLDNPMAVET